MVLDWSPNSSSPTLMKRLLPRHLSGLLTKTQYPPPFGLHHALPAEIFIEIAGFLESDQLLNFSLVVIAFPCPFLLRLIVVA
jgi:hypothetical protein